MTVRARPVFIAALYAALSVLICARVFAQPNAAPLDRGSNSFDGGDAPLQDVTIDPYLGDAPMLRALMSGRATFRCYEPLGLIQLTAPERPLVFAEGPLSVMKAAFTPNRIDVTIDQNRRPRDCSRCRSPDRCGYGGGGWREESGP
jgi:hypothetical protein